ncbi:MAG: hypothetical protein WDM80_16445 [Limisphaerales bacterium]
MKFKNLIPQRFRRQFVRQFGQAKLIKLPNGQHELIGGTDADRIAAFEWVSVFAHEIVFTHFHCKSKRSSGRVARQPRLWKWWPVAQPL